MALTISCSGKGAESLAVLSVALVRTRLLDGGFVFAGDAGKTGFIPANFAAGKRKLGE